MPVPLSQAPQPFAYTSPAEAWYWNGLPLQSAYGAWNIQTFGGSRFSVPVFRGQNYAVPFRAGQAQRQKLPDSRTITLTMWADGVGDHPQETYPAPDQRLGFNDNIQALRQAFFQQDAWGSVQGQLARNWWVTQQGIPALVESVAMAELAGSMDLTMNGRTNAGFAVDLLLADPFFYGAQQSQAIGTGGGAITGLGEGIAGLGFPSVVATFTVEITAACTVTNETAGVSFTFSPSGSPSYPVTVDILNQTVTDEAAGNWVAGISHAGSRAWMVVLPGANQISVSAGDASFAWSDCYI